MSEQKSIDVVIPSYRLDEDILLNIFNLPSPAGYIVHYYLIADNPGITIPKAINDLALAGKIHLLVNDTNMGYSPTRNKGIDAGSGAWVLLLDDDIVPSRTLLTAYGDAIEAAPCAVGFLGPTEFPQPFNTVTHALFLNGSIGHFLSPKSGQDLAWAPTANVMLNRKQLGERRFNAELVYGGEDVEFLTRNGLENQKKYRSVPNATVVHPWWGNGSIQWTRLFRYGAGTGDIMRAGHIRPFTYIDFPNTVESILLSLLAIVIAGFLEVNITLILLFAGAVLIAEIATMVIKSMRLSGRFSLPLAWQMLLHKNMYEAGMLWINLKKGRLDNFARRVDLGFSKTGPRPFRLNKWKIVKLILILILTLIFFS